MEREQKGFLIEQQHRISLVFSLVDTGKKGYLTREELKLAIVEFFGYKPSKYEVNEILSKEHSISCGVSRELFYDIMNSKLSTQDHNDEIRQTFVAFDTKCRGFVGFDDAKIIFEQAAPFIKPFDLQRIFREVDQDGDGRVSFKDFEHMMKFAN